MRDPCIDGLIDEVGLPEASGRLRVAGIIFTYRCSIACRHCLFNCSPGWPDVAMTPQQCAEALGLLHETRRVVHIAGGEAMLYWDALAEGVRLAHRDGNAPHFVETNCSFAVSDGVVRERLGFLVEHGVRGIYASACPYHQEFVPPERFLRVRRITREVFGERCFYGPGSSDAEVRVLADVSRDEGRLREYARRGTPMLVGRAQRMLAPYLDTHPAGGATLPGPGRAEGGERACARVFRADSIWEFHIDPYGNIQTNCGMILGRTAEVRPVALLARGPERANRFVQIVCTEGPRGLADYARREHGFTPPERACQTCELCYLTRRYLRQFAPEVFGPAEIYQ